MNNLTKGFGPVTGSRGRVLLLGLGALVLSDEVMALCEAPSQSANIAAITVQRDAPIGSVIGSGTVVTAMSCGTTGSDLSDNSWLVFPAATNVDFGPTSQLNVRATAWPGVGLRWTNLSSAANNSAVIWTRAAINSHPKSSGRGMPVTTRNTFTDTFELIKTGPISSGVMPAISLHYFYATPVTNNVNAPLFTLTVAPVPIRAVACSVTQTAITVPMGNFIPKTRFTGPGSTDTDISFPVSLECDSAARVNIQLDGVAVGGAAPGVLRLNAQDGAASGLGVQILKDRVPVTFGAPMFVGTSTVDGPYTIDFVARYYQVDGTVESGVANATATFTMTYN